LGTTRTDQPGLFADESGRRIAKASGGVEASLVSQNGQKVVSLTMRPDATTAKVMAHQGRPLEVLQELLATPELADGEYFGVAGHLGHIPEFVAIQRALRVRDTRIVGGNRGFKQCSQGQRHDGQSSCRFQGSNQLRPLPGQPSVSSLKPQKCYAIDSLGVPASTVAADDLSGSAATTIMVTSSLNWPLQNAAASVITRFANTEAASSRDIRNIDSILQSPYSFPLAFVASVMPSVNRASLSPRSILMVPSSYSTSDENPSTIPPVVRGTEGPEL
jgi:hypothetical protein